MARCTKTVRSTWDLRTARVELALNMCNRHGLIAGASGTGKTITMKVMAESFSDAGVPVFLCDVKGDVAGICAPGVSSEGMEKRIDRFGLRGSFTYKGYPTTFWDIYQTGGHAVRATVSDMGPELLSRILSLTPAQEGILHIMFRIADDKGLLLLDLKDLRAMLNYVSEHRAEYMMTYGNITPQSVAAILRALLPLEQQGGELFRGHFGRAHHLVDLGGIIMLSSCKCNDLYIITHTHYSYTLCNTSHNTNITRSYSDNNAVACNHDNIIVLVNDLNSANMTSFFIDLVVFKSEAAFSLKLVSVQTASFAESVFSYCNERSTLTNSCH